MLASAAKLLPIVGAYVVLDSFQCMIQGVLRGSGKQSLGAIVAMVGFYVVTLPTAYAFAFPLDWGLTGLWVGMSCGYVIISIVYVCAMCTLNWNRAAECAVALATPCLEPLLMELHTDKGKKKGDKSKSLLVSARTYGTNSGFDVLVVVEEQPSPYMGPEPAPARPHNSSTEEDDVSSQESHEADGEAVYVGGAGYVAAA